MPDSILNWCDTAALPRERATFSCSVQLRIGHISTMKALAQRSLVVDVAWIARRCASRLPHQKINRSCSYAWRVSTMGSPVLCNLPQL